MLGRLQLTGTIAGSQRAVDGRLRLGSDGSREWVVLAVRTVGGLSPRRKCEFEASLGGSQVGIQLQSRRVGWAEG